MAAITDFDIARPRKPRVSFMSIIAWLIERERRHLANRKIADMPHEYRKDIGITAADLHRMGISPRDANPGVWTARTLL